MLLSLFLLVTVLPSGWAEGNPIQDPQAGIGEETTAPEGRATAESVPGHSDWETRLLLMLQEHDANPDTIAAGYYNLATGEEHYYNGDQYRVSGSMYKVPLNMLFLDWIAEGKSPWTSPSTDTVTPSSWKAPLSTPTTNTPSCSGTMPGPRSARILPPPFIIATGS